MAENDIDTALRSAIINREAKNVVLFVGDGLGPNTVTAARIYGPSESGYLAFEKFPHIGVLKVGKNLKCSNSSHTYDV